MGKAGQCECREPDGHNWAEPGAHRTAAVALDREHRDQYAGSNQDDVGLKARDRDLKAFEATFNFPSIRLASNTLAIIELGYHQPQMFQQGALKDWDHSAWERRAVIHAGEDKVHIDTRFTRYRADGGVIGGFDSIYVVTRENGHWGIKARSSFAP